MGTLEARTAETTVLGILLCGLAALCPAKTVAWYVESGFGPASLSMFLEAGCTEAQELYVALSQTFAATLALAPSCCTGFRGGISRWEKR